MNEPSSIPAVRPAGRPRASSRRAAPAWLALVALLAVAPAVAMPNLDTPGLINEKPGALTDVGITQKLDQQVPLDLVFRDESGTRVPLSTYFGKRPVVLALVYYECPMLCTLTLNGLLRALRALSMLPGREFDIVTVSFNPSETVKQAAEKKRAYLAQLGRKGAEQGWHFLTGDTDSIRALTRAVGFSYRWDTASKQYAHATGLMVLTPAGKLSRYFYGVEYAAGDLRLALIEAADNKIGSAVDQVLLYCYRYDPTTGKYALVIMNVIRVAGVATVLALLGAVFVFLRRDRRTAPGLGAPLTDHAG